jgi:hypothetical protein
VEHPRSDLADLSAPERRLVAAVLAGDELDLARKKHAREPVAPKEMLAWGQAHEIRAEVIRRILLGRLAADPDPRGIRLRGARIVGRLDLNCVTSVVPLTMISCQLRDGAELADATLAAVVLRECLIEHPDRSPLLAARLTTGLLDLSRATVVAHGERPAIDLEGSDLGQLTADGASLTSDWGPALSVREGHVRRDMRLTRFEDDDGSYRRFEATGRGDNGTIYLWGAQVDGALYCSGEVSNGSGPAVEATAATIGLAVLMVGLQATGDGGGGAVRFRSTRIGGSLLLTHASVVNSTGPAVVADGLTVTGDVSLSELAARGWGTGGVLSLAGAHVDGDVRARGAKIDNVSWSGGSGGGPAVRAGDLAVGHDLRFSDGFTASGGGDDGVIYLPGARVGGQLVVMDATLSCDAGPALYADGLVVSQDLYLLRLAATGAGEHGVLVLSNAQVSHDFAYRPRSIVNATFPASLVNVDGLTYGGLPTGLTPAEWLDILRHATPRYAAQPYQYLAAALTAAGDDDGASGVLIAQRQDQLDRRALTGARGRAWARFTGVILGYGYRPSRALVFLLGVVTASVLLALLLGAHGALAQTSAAGDVLPHAPCTALQRIAVGLNLGEPFLSASPRCDVTATSAASAFTIVRWFLQVAVWALATLFIAGFTSAVRKS